MKDKSLIGLIIGIAVILGVGIAEQIYLEKLAKNIIDDVEKIETLVNLGDIKNSELKLQNIISDWEKSENFLKIIIHHDDIQKISEALIEIDNNLKDFLDRSSVSANFALLKEYIINIEEENKFTINNIL